MTPPTDDVAQTVLALADELHAEVLAASPFFATMLGIPGHDARVPDLSVEAEQAYADRVAQVRERAAAVDPEELSARLRVTRAAVLNTADAQLAGVATASVEHALSVLGDGPPALFGLAGRAALTTPQKAQDFLARTRAYPQYVAQQVERLQTGARSGRTPVGALVDVALAQVDGYLAAQGADVLADVAPPEGWDGAEQWQRELRDVVRSDVRPSLAAWRDAVADLPTRSDGACGLVHLPGGAADYDRLVALHTTLPLTADEVHEIGQQDVATLVERMTALGAELGLSGFDAVRDAVRASAAGISATEAMQAAREAVSEAERAVVGVFPEPLPPPCEVQPMSPFLGRAGTPPHYTPPRRDGSARGTYWFNAEQLGAGSGWDLAATAFHEAVPGHHLQLSRMQSLDDVPALQSQGLVTAHAEGWGLYAEVLAGELGLYRTVEQRLGALGVQLFRAARLVVDTGIHARGWSRPEAVAYMTSTVPLPEAFVASEVNRYIGLPGQALAYQIGQRELLALRAQARSALGERFDLAAFHAAVLDSGMLPLAALRTAVEEWIASG